MSRVYVAIIIITAAGMLGGCGYPIEHVIAYEPDYVHPSLGVGDAAGMRMVAGDAAKHDYLWVTKLPDAGLPDAPRGVIAWLWSDEPMPTGSSTMLSGVDDWQVEGGR